MANGFFQDNYFIYIVIPVLKNGQPPNLLISYRPIALFSVLCKITERTINIPLEDHLMNHNLLAIQQAGFDSLSVGKLNH
jgi:hypothetical protein